MHVNPAYRIEPNRRVLTRARGSRSFGSPTFEAGWVAQPAPQDAVVPTGAFKRQDLPEAAEQAHPVNFHFRTLKPRRPCASTHSAPISQQMARQSDHGPLRHSHSAQPCSGSSGLSPRMTESRSASSGFVFSLRQRNPIRAAQPPASNPISQMSALRRSPPLAVRPFSPSKMTMTAGMR